MSGALRSVAASATAEAAMGPGPARASYSSAVRAWQEALGTQGALLEGLSHLLDAAATAYAQTDRDAFHPDRGGHG